MDSERRFGQTASVFACPENEAFLKMVEDPMVYIRQKELEARHAVFDNPLKMKQIRQEIEALKRRKRSRRSITIIGVVGGGHPHQMVILQERRSVGADLETESSTVIIVIDQHRLRVVTSLRDIAIG